MHDIDRMLQLQLEGRHVEARAISDKLQELGPERIPDPTGKVGNREMWIRHSFNRGWFLLQEGRYQEGCQLLDNGRYINVYGSPPLKTNAPIYNPKEHSIKGKSIIISLEGGYGDEIIHARFATSFKKLGADKIYLTCNPNLIELFSRIEGVDKCITRENINTVSHDYWIPGFSAGWLAGHTFEDLPNKPYLSATLNLVNSWKNIINSNKIKVGIRWAGNPKFEHQQFRKFPENFMINLSKYSEIQFYSLQRDNNIIDLPSEIIDLQHSLTSWEDTAAAIMNLDLVITSCTSVAHLSAALGKETWIVVPILPYHTWTYNAPSSNTSPYYQTVRLFRQRNAGKWNDAFQSLYSALESKFNLAHLCLPNEDKITKKLNLGCGLQKALGFINVDYNKNVEPDLTIDLNVFPWPWGNNEIAHIFAKDVLGYLGNTKEDFLKIIKEMYRISENGSIWEIQIPHWRCDAALDDPMYKFIPTIGTFSLFNQRLLAEQYDQRLIRSTIAIEEGIDIEICDVQFEYLEHWLKKMQNKEITQDELTYALNTFNNVASAVRLLIQVHKPVRTPKSKFINLVS